MVDLPSLTPNDNLKTPVTIDPQRISLFKTPWYAEGSTTTITHGQTPASTASGLDSVGTTVDIEMEWLRHKPSHHVDKIQLKVDATNKLQIDSVGNIEYTYYDSSQPSLTQAGVKKILTPSNVVLVDNTISYIGISPRGLEATHQLDLMMDWLIPASDIIIVATALAAGGEIKSINMLTNPDHPTGINLPGQLARMQDMLGVFQRNIAPVIVGNRDPSQQSLNIVNNPDMFFCGTFMNPTPLADDSLGFYYTGVPIEDNNAGTLMIIDTHGAILQKPFYNAPPRMSVLKAYYSILNSPIPLTTNQYTMHPIYCYTLTRADNPAGTMPATIKLAILLTNKVYTRKMVQGVLEPITPQAWQLEECVSSIAKPRFINDYCALCGLLVVPAEAQALADCKVVQLSQGLSRVSNNAINLSDASSDVMVPVAVHDEILNQGLGPMTDGAMPYIDRFKRITSANLQKSSSKLKKFKVTYSQGDYTIEGMNFTITPTQLQSLKTQYPLQFYFTGALDQNFKTVYFSLGVHTAEKDFIAKVLGLTDSSAIAYAIGDMDYTHWFGGRNAYTLQIKENSFTSRNIPSPTRGDNRQQALNTYTTIRLGNPYPTAAPVISRNTQGWGCISSALLNILPDQFTTPAPVIPDTDFSKYNTFGFLNNGTTITFFNVNLTGTPTHYDSADYANRMSRTPQSRQDLFTAYNKQLNASREIVPARAINNYLNKLMPYINYTPLAFSYVHHMVKGGIWNQGSGSTSGFWLLPTPTYQQTPLPTANDIDVSFIFTVLLH